MTQKKKIDTPKPKGQRDLTLDAADRVRAVIQDLFDGKHDPKYRANKSELGRDLGISQPAVFKILDQGGGMRRQTAMKAARLAGVSPQVLLGEEPDMMLSGHRNLEICIAYHADRWPPPVIAAARAFAGSDIAPDAWAERLDALAVAVRSILKQDN